MRIQETSHNTSFCYGLIVTNIETETNRCRFFNKKISAIHQINQYSVGKEQETLFSNGFFIYPLVSSIFPVEQLETFARHLSLSVYLL